MTADAGKVNRWSLRTTNVETMAGKEAMIPVDGKQVEADTTAVNWVAYLGSCTRRLSCSHRP